MTQGTATFARRREELCQHCSTCGLLSGRDNTTYGQSHFSNFVCYLLFFIIVSIFDGAGASSPSTQIFHPVLNNHTDQSIAQSRSANAKVSARSGSGGLLREEELIRNGGNGKKSNHTHLNSNQTDLQPALFNRRFKPINAYDSGSSRAYQWPSSFFARDVPVPLYPQAQATGDQCDLPQVIGTGPYRIPRWYFNPNTRRCELFYYSGCCGNGNNFPTYEACQLICEVDPCTQSRDPGVGSLQIPRFYFNRATKLCEAFTYFGSGGNRNNFASVQDCRKKCPESPNPCAYGEPMRQGGTSTGFLPCGFGSMVTNICPVHFYCHVGSTVTTTVCCPKPAGAPERCQQPQRPGVGGEILQRWFFEPYTQECKQFEYKGLQGNENNFLVKSDCENTCFVNPCSNGQPLRSNTQVVQCQLTNGQPSCPDRYYCHVGIDARSTVCCPTSGDPCQQPIKGGTGPTSVAILRWTYDSFSRTCRQFNYTGLGGNENNFLTEQACRVTCKVFTNVCKSGPPVLLPSGQPATCKRREDCPFGYWCHVGTRPESTMCCPGTRISPCLVESDAGVGSEIVPRWFYDVRTHKCMPFTYTGKGGNQNNFISKEECLRMCPEILNPCPLGEPVMEPGPGGFVLPLSCNPHSAEGFCPPKNWCHVGESEETTVCCPQTSGYPPSNICQDPCLLPAAAGNGRTQLQRWHYNSQTMTCLPFSYTGIRGNENNFVTREACEAKCPVFRNPCLGGPVQVDAAGRPKPCSTIAGVSIGSCGPGFYCHIGNSRETTVCCPSIGNACELPVAVGVGNVSLPRFYFNPITRQCVSFQYRGTQGNDNNFVSEAACTAQCPVFTNPCPDAALGNLTRISSVRYDGSYLVLPVQPPPCGHARSCPSGHWCHVGASVETTVCCKFAKEIQAHESLCDLPAVAGSGSATLNRWHYNANTRECSHFQYKGLHGNANNFLTKEECEQACPTFINACAVGQPYLVGNKVQWCGPNAHPCPTTYWCHIGASFETTMCCPQARNPCETPHMAGTGTSQLARWYFDVATRTCQQFHYRGLQGNPNNFLTKEDCETVCPVFENPCANGQPATGPTGRPQMCNPRNAHSSTSCPVGYWCHGGASAETTICCPGRQDPCQLPMNVGYGNFSLQRWYFDPTERICKQFNYRGAKGNPNNFLSPDECMTVCPVFVDPCPASNATIGRQAPQAVIYCSPAVVAAAFTSIHHQRRQAPSKDQRIATANVCPPGHWCHIGADAKTTVCCPNAASEPCKETQSRGAGTLSLSRYYFDSNSQQCYQFSYSGLGGNQNNFLTRTQCEKECPVFTNPCRRGEPLVITGRPQLCSPMQPCPPHYWCHLGTMAETTVCCPSETTEPCMLPLDPGVGGSALVRWYYSSINRQCIQFSYQGLRGNQNNFLTREDCERTCRVNPCAGGEPATDSGVLQQCTLGTTCPVGYWCHYGGNAQTTVCCPGALANICELPRVQGFGSATLSRYYYNAVTRDCVPFIYRGSGGNQNNFLTAAECRTACPGTPNPCRTGEPPRDNQGGYQQCDVQAGRRSCPDSFWCHPGTEAAATVCCPGAESPCVLPVLQGTGDANVTRWHYNSLNHQCAKFQYRGLSGNQNNFLSEQECSRVCPVAPNPCAQGQPLALPNGQPMYCAAPTFPMNCPPGSWCHYGPDRETTVCCPNAVPDRDICNLEPNRGRGILTLNRWYFDQRAHRCSMFVYSGIGGNQNNFMTREECAVRCPEFRNPCALPLPSPMPIFCSVVNPMCPPGLWCHLGQDPETTICCPGAMDNPCILPMNPGFGDGQLARFYFNSELNQCTQFMYRGSQGNQNNFISLEECQQRCNPFGNPCPSGDPLMSPGPSPFNRPQTCNALSISPSCPAGYWCHIGATLETTLCCPNAGDPCTQPVAHGLGSASIPRFYYDQGSRQCMPFTYTGSKGNQNNFASMEACRMACRESRNPCIGQPAVTPTGQNVFCSSTNRDSCPVNYWCHIGSAAETTLCCPGATNPCSVPLSPGTGSDNLQRYYYNSDSRTCVGFTYNGLGGNQNNFQSLSECQATCPVIVNPCVGGQPAIGRGNSPLHCGLDTAKATGKSMCPATHWCHLGTSLQSTVCCPGAVDKPCLLVKTAGRGAEKVQRWYFDTVSHKCQRFEYTGLGGNQNNFASQAECQRICQEAEHPCLGEPERDESGQPKNCYPFLSTQCGSGYFCHTTGPGVEGPNYCCPAAGELCDAPKLEGEGDAVVPRWYYNRNDHTCEQFSYYGRKGNQNNFISQEDCLKKCKPEVNPCMAGDTPMRRGNETVRCLPDRPSCPITHYCHVGDDPSSTVCCPRRGNPCQQAPYTGSGLAKLNRWFYSPQEDECFSFTYTGRGGNENNFLTQQDCEQTCPGFRGLCPHSKPTLVKGHPQECGVQISCPVNFVCHVNTQQSKSICCPDPAYFCILPRDPGPCSNFTTHYGYSRETGTCVPFKYGGCGGNENNFKSLERCTEVCCDKGF